MYPCGLATGEPSSAMSKKSSQSLADELKPYVAPFRFDGSGEFHLKSHQTNEKGGLDKEKGDEDHRGQPRAPERFAGKALRAGPLVAAADLPGHGRRRQGQRDQERVRGRQSAGLRGHSFKQPSTDELDHDFLWRSTIALPERGRIGIFNRSYYEECLVVRVHPEILAKQKIPPKLVTKDIWRERFEDISAFERYLARNGTVILKFFLNVSKEEQRERFLERLEEPAKNWKFSMGDIAERALWDEYQAAYQDMIRHTSTNACAVARGAGRPQMVRARGDRLDHRRRAGEARPAFPEGRQGARSEFKQVRTALLAEGKG